MRSERSVVCVSEATRQKSDEFFHRITAAFGRAQSGFQVKIKADIALGGEWRLIKDEIKKIPGLTIKRLMAEHKFEVSSQHLNGCDRAWKCRDEYEAANNWYEQAGFEAGWRLKKTTGWERVVGVVSLYKKRDEKPPNVSASKQKQNQKDTMEALKKNYALEKAARFDVQLQLLRACIPSSAKGRLKLPEADIRRARSARDLGISTQYPEERVSAAVKKRA